MKKRSVPRLFKFLLAIVLCLLVTFAILYGGDHSTGSDNGLSRWTHADWKGFPSGYLVESNRGDATIKSRRSIDGAAMSRPCCVSWGPGRVDCFVRSDKGSVLHWRREDGKDHAWDSLGGYAIGEIECVTRGKGHIDLLIVGSNNGLLSKTHDGYWGDWIARGGRIMETPSCVARTPSVVDCAVRRSDLGAYHIGHVNN